MKKAESGERGEGGGKSERLRRGVGHEAGLSSRSRSSRESGVKGEGRALSASLPAVGGWVPVGRKTAV